ncbi:MAG: heavy-metal-associated domain-containing protein [Chloroflexi bacterium]|nr:heavy-metal-associated domain-containing protein [Chloroflexota bacterium]MDA1145798.1 heavy-metal-associated domain-containing protein [Chloroflexota bacterium]
MQLTLYAPDVTCEHCIATIQKAVGTVDGATFVSGDPDGKSFVIEVASGAVIDRVAAATEAEGYPLGDAAPAAEHGGTAADPNWVPTYTVTGTDKGADINYACPCSCTAGFGLDRAVADQHAEGCCCGRQMLVAPTDAEARLKADLSSGEYRFNLQTIEMPWGQPMQAAIAIPVEA